MLLLHFLTFKKFLILMEDKASIRMKGYISWGYNHHDGEYS